MINRAFGDQPPSVLTLAAERQGLLREVGKENRVPASPTRVQDAADALGRAVGGVESSRAFRYASEVRPKLLELEDAEVIAAMRAASIPATCSHGTSPR